MTNKPQLQALLDAVKPFAEYGRILMGQRVSADGVVVEIFDTKLTVGDFRSVFSAYESALKLPRAQNFNDWATYQGNLLADMSREDLLTALHEQHRQLRDAIDEAYASASQRFSLPDPPL